MKQKKKKKKTKTKIQYLESLCTKKGKIRTAQNLPQLSGKFLRLEAETHQFFQTFLRTRRNRLTSMHV